LVLTFYFSLDSDKVSRLTIAANKPSYERHYSAN
jgi:hypothetical protein